MCDVQRNGLIWLGSGHVVDCCECGNEPPSSIKCGECSLFPSWSRQGLVIAPVNKVVRFLHCGHYMYHQLNIQQLYVLPTQCISLYGID